MLACQVIYRKCSPATPCFVPPIDSRRQAAGSTRSQSGPQLASQKPPCTLLTRSLIARPDHQSAEEQSGEPDLLSLWSVRAIHGGQLCGLAEPLDGARETEDHRNPVMRMRKVK